MARGIDFLLLYREFQLEPGAGIDDLKRAYRRRVSMVHPDRLDAKDCISQHLATEHLQRLTTLYEAGVQFHRQHGRLPGASSTAEMHSGPNPEDKEHPPATPVGSQTHRLRWAFGVIFLIAVLAWWLWPVDSVVEPVKGHAKPAARDFALGAKAPSRFSGKDGILPGMHKEAVLRIQGAPVMREGERWLYGPSWILFEEGKVSEWYSSPLHPLRISSESE